MLIFKIICIIGICIQLFFGLLSIYLCKKHEDELDEAGINRAEIYGTWIAIIIETAALMYIIMN